VKGFSFILFLSLAAHAFAAAPNAAPPDAWPVLRGTSDGCGVSGGTLSDKPQLAWTFTAEKRGFQAGAVIAGGNVYAVTTSGLLYSIDLATGRKNWEFDSHSKFAASPAVRDGRVYVGDISDNESAFHCIDAATGKELWKFPTEDKIYSSAAFYRNRVLFGSDDSTAYCLDAAGKLVWKFDMDDYVRCPVTVAGNRGYFAGCSGILYVMDLDKGTALAKIPFDSPTGCAAAVFKDRAYVGDEESQFLAIDLTKQAIDWQFKAEDTSMAFRSSAAVTDEGVYVGSRDKKLHALDPRTGKPLWEFDTRGMVDSSPVVIGERLFFGSQDGRIYALDRKSGKEVWRFDAGGKIYASPAVASGRLVIGSDSGKLYCFK
jgi:outer membrane protein assembly factor BamB